MKVLVHISVPELIGLIMLGLLLIIYGIAWVMDWWSSRKK